MSPTASSNPVFPSHHSRTSTFAREAVQFGNSPFQGGLPPKATVHEQWRKIMLLAAAIFAFNFSGCDSSSDQTTTAPSSSQASQQTASAEAGSPDDDAPVEQQSELPRQQQLKRADRLLDLGQSDQAAAILTRLLITDAQDVDVLFRLANVRAADNDLPSAVELLESIPESHPVAGLPALGQAADWCFQLQRYADAEQKYTRILNIAPDAALAHRQLAYLLNRQGRRHEASRHIRELCKLGDVRQDELHSLIVVSDAMVSPDDSAASNSVSYEPIGVSGKARILFTEKRFAEAAELLEPIVASGSALPAISALYGRALAEAQDENGFRRWLNQADASVKQFSEYWAGLAAYLAGQQETQAAIRASLESLDRDPTDFAVINRLLKLYKVLDSRDEYAVWEARWKALHKILTSNNQISSKQPPDVAEIDELAAQLFALDRKLEAVIWKWLEAYYRQLPKESLKHWSEQRIQLVASDQCFPDQSSRLCGIKLGSYPLPDIQLSARQQQTPPGDRTPVIAESTPATFRNVADQIGLAHRYRVAAGEQGDGFAMYQQPGGGVAVLDWDRDGSPDLFFAQGAADPPKFITDQSDVLYRNTGGKLIDVTISSHTTDDRYTIGCSAGDWNQDGLADLVTTSIGGNRLLINNGDGTFRAQSIDGSDDLERMPASIAIADLNGDHIPDLFELNYIKDADLARLPKRDESGQVVDAVGPGDFSSAMDRVGINDARGGIQIEPISDDPGEAHKALGIVIANLDGKPGNDVFVGNDKSPNQLWVRHLETQSWTNVAVASGSAYSSGGASTASMGIAADDFDFNGQLDLVITNFQNESVCLYLNRDGFFRDRAIQYRLDVPSRSVLGFGSQSLDYDNNGLPDLVVTNGHIDRYLSMSGPFEQAPQLFSNHGDRFELNDVDDPSGYWSKQHLGRSLATVDFNQDGRLDFAITHVGETSAMLMNETRTDHHWLQIALVGTRSERDAVGAKVTIQSGQWKATRWSIGGDGYLACNESILSFGLGDRTQVDRIRIEWPSGIVQVIDSVAVDQRLLIVENQSVWSEFGNE